MSVNDDWNGLTFISSIEHKQYPFYGVQFHPEKTLYEWVRNKNISHTTHATAAAQYFAEFFVAETRKNGHHFADAKTEDGYVIYNYPSIFTGAVGSAFEQSYMFPENITYAIDDVAADVVSVDPNTAAGTYSLFILTIASLLISIKV